MFAVAVAYKDRIFPSGSGASLKKYFPIAAFLAVAVATLAMAVLSHLYTQETARLKFAAVADDALNRIDGRVSAGIALLQSTKAFVDTDGGNLSGGKFAEFFGGLNVAGSGLRGLGYLSLIKPGEEAPLQARLRLDHGIDREIHPASTEEFRTPVMLYQPLDHGNVGILGYDMYTDETRRKAIDMALSATEPRASGRVILGERTGSDTHAGFLVFMKLSPKAALPATAEPGPVRPAGLVFASFRSEELFIEALQRIPRLPVSLEVFDGEIGEDHLLYRSTEPVNADLDRFATSRQLVVAGRSWTVVFHPTSAFEPPLSMVVPFAIGFFGLLLAATIALAARYQERALDAAAKLHEASEKSLAERELMLQEMKHRIKNSIARVLAMSRQTAAHSDSLDAFSASFSARLQAMAASQDMLTRSRWQKADLDELLRMELGQVFGKEIPEGVLKGPPVELDEVTTQSLGLTFHELATNALKYGDAGQSVGMLKVEWALFGPRRGKRLQLIWLERSSQPISPPSKKGFGTKLIDMNITRELGGTIKRVFGDDGLRIEIDLPYKL